MGTCPKCEKPYFRLGKKFEVHVASCQGVKYVTPKKRIKTPVFMSPTAPDPVQIYEQSLAGLRARKAALEAELRGVDATILEIEELKKGAGGSAPVPFANGSPVKPFSVSSTPASAAV